MLIRDEVVQSRHARRDPIESHRADVAKYVENQLATAEYIGDEDNDPTIFDRQRGEELAYEVFEAKLKKCNPDLHFLTFPLNPHKRVCFRVLSGEPTPLCVYDIGPGPMPEYSILERRPEETYDLSIRTIDRKDINPDGTWKGKKTVYRTGKELRRGWRTVLLYLLKERALTLAQVETTFGHGTRQSWAAHARGTSTSIW